MEEFTLSNEEIKYVDRYYSNNLEKPANIKSELKKEKEIYKYSLRNRKNEITAFKLTNEEILKDDAIRDEEYFIQLGKRLAKESIERLKKEREEIIKELESRKQE